MHNYKILKEDSDTKGYVEEIGKKAIQCIWEHLACGHKIKEAYVDIKSHDYFEINIEYDK